MNNSNLDIQVQDIDHLGIVAGIVDEIGLVEEIDRQIGVHPQQILSTGQVVKAMILNGLGFVSAPLYLFSAFFEGKATEHLLGPGVLPEHLNDDRLGRALDALWQAGLSQIFVSIALQVYQIFCLQSKSIHLDSSNFHVHGAYLVEPWRQLQQPEPIVITYGHSKDHRPDLKQFTVELICGGDGDIPLFFQAADGNASDQTTFVPVIEQFREQWQLDVPVVADCALYTEENLKQLGDLKWISRVPLTIKQAQEWVDSLTSEAFESSRVKGYRIAQRSSDYAGVSQRWLVVESEHRQRSDLKALKKRLSRQQQQAQSQLQTLSQEEFSCEADACKAALKLQKRWKYYQLEQLEIVEKAHYATAGRPRKGTKPKRITYHVQAQVVADSDAIAVAERRAGRFIVATNIVEVEDLSNDEVLEEYKGQQGAERGFRFLKDPLFFADSVFLKTPARVAALAMVMALCLLIYTLGQRMLRQTLAKAKAGIPNQLGKKTSMPTLRWVFQCFQSVHLLRVNGQQHISNLSDNRLLILRFLGSACQKYYLLC